MIDYRSDTVTKPSQKMLEVMITAELGDDVYGDDPTVNAFEKKMAALTGFEAAMIVNSGTQSNLCALLAHCSRGEEYIVGQGYHTYLYEAGGAAVLGSVVPQPISVQPSGELAFNDIEAVIKEDDQHFAKSKLLSLENTHCGKVIPLDYFIKARKLANKHNLAIHLDGARIFNALTELNIELAEMCQYVDSISICFSKGLGTPMGSVLCGSKEIINKARRIRKMVGGGTRQAGLIAKAMDYALEHNVSKLADDHANAKLLANLLSDCDELAITEPQTNMVYITLDEKINAQLMAKLLLQEGIKVSAGQTLRLVTHLNIDKADIIYTADTIKDILSLM
ncbi:low-specificity L-threonine aldolase [Thalassomonas sp. M1454]|uniref:low-specificity L-threonine aldolase n=1 Tax=Thalassomonas sp. M1454 TaxID=2594477 RepID=UPI00117DC343|nr:low-specificity L-threonine aldolase [Thalassomonas sp. M1454]TRX56318.1 low-specificity L-threonine aldolase [Thalassomonas sp. M1454]